MMAAQFELMRRMNLDAMSGDTHPHYSSVDLDDQRDKKEQPMPKPSHGLTVISDSAVEAAGVVTYWNLTKVTVTRLIKAVKMSGIGSIKLPSATTKPAALRRALNTACGQLDALLFVRTLPGTTGEQFIVVRQREDEFDRILSTKFVIDDHGAKIPEFHLFPDVEITVDVAALMTGIKAMYEAEVDAFHPTEFGNWLISTIEAAPFNALRLRENGGVYFVPSSARASWDSLTSSINAYASESCVFHELPTVRSEEAAFAVTAALTESINQAVATIRAELESGALKTRALTTRAEEAKSLLLRVKLYESTLGVQLDELVQLCHGLEVSVATASLAAQAEASSP